MFAKNEIYYFKNNKFAAEQDQPAEKNPQKPIGFEEMGYPVLNVKDDFKQDLKYDGSKNRDGEGINHHHWTVFHKQI